MKSFETVNQPITRKICVERHVVSIVDLMLCNYPPVARLSVGWTMAVTPVALSHQQPDRSCFKLLLLYLLSSSYSPSSLFFSPLSTLLFLLSRVYLFVNITGPDAAGHPPLLLLLTSAIRCSGLIRRKRLKEVNFVASDSSNAKKQTLEETKCAQECLCSSRRGCAAQSTTL